MDCENLSDCYEMYISSDTQNKLEISSICKREKLLKGTCNINLNMIMYTNPLCII